MKTKFGEITKIEDLFEFLGTEKLGEPRHIITEENGFEHYSAGEWYITKVKCNLCGDLLEGHPDSGRGADAGFRDIGTIMDEHIKLHERLGRLESLLKTQK